MSSEKQTIEYRLFGLDEETVRHRLAEIDGQTVTATVTANGPDSMVHLTGESTALESAKAQLTRDWAGYCYSDCGETLEQRVVCLLREKGKTVSLAESCTGGWTASRLTGVSGCSAVFGTGVVSYSWDCKEKLLHVSPNTLKQFGAVSEQTAIEMAQGIRRCSGADLGLSITGEAGPQPAENQPVGTVFIALADAKRVWVKECHLDLFGSERNDIRYWATSCALDLVRRYLEALPTVMAGGEKYGVSEMPRRASPVKVRGLRRLFPWHSGGMIYAVLKGAVWLIVLALLVTGLVMGYRILMAPTANRQLQESLVQLYASEPEDLTENQQQSLYPVGMLASFRSLYTINPRIGGWVRISDTGINYPVMTGEDDEYYNHGFDGQHSSYGQPYFHQTNVIGPLSRNRVLSVYGKNTHDGQMFSDLLLYRNLSFLKLHPMIEMNTLYATGRWEIFAVCVTDKAEWTVEQTPFQNEDAMEQYLSQLMRRSLFLSDQTVSAKDEILLLTTDAEREYGFSHAQLTVAARRVSAEEDQVPTYRNNKSVRMPAVWRKRHTTTAWADEKMSTTETKSNGGASETTETAKETVPSTASTTSVTVSDETEEENRADFGN